MYYHRRTVPPTVFRPVSVALTPHHAAWPESAAEARALNVSLVSRFAAHRRLLANVCYGRNAKNDTTINTDERSPTQSPAHPVPHVLRPVPQVPPPSN